jgi:uncharacterized membrane protein
MSNLILHPKELPMLSSLTAVTATLTLAMIGAMAGLFFAYSVSVMIGLDRINSAEAIRAMQSINQRIQNPVFLSVFMLAPVAVGVTSGLLYKLGHNHAAVAFLIAGLVYLVGSIGVSAAVNIALNNDLDKVQLVEPSTSSAPATISTGESADKVWSDYSDRWTRWNHIRTVLNLVSLLLVGLGLFVWGRQGWG